jgi:hypothetical protein
MPEAALTTKNALRGNLQILDPNFRLDVRN